MKPASEPTTQTDWQERFEKQFCFDLYTGDHHKEGRYKKTLRTNIDQTDDLKSFIANERKLVLEEVKALVKEYDESPDEMAGFEIRIKKPTLFYEALEKLEDK